MHSHNNTLLRYMQGLAYTKLPSKMMLLLMCSLCFESSESHASGSPIHQKRKAVGFVLENKPPEKKTPKKKNGGWVVHPPQPP
jgi:hypothetical protein